MTVRRLALVAVCVAATGCGLGESLGLGDARGKGEFRSVGRAPLAMPPGARQRPGLGQPAEARDGTRDAAGRETVFGQVATQDQVPDRVGVSVGETAILSRAGAEGSTDRIRAVVDEESADILAAEEPLVRQILFPGAADAGPDRLVGSSDPFLPPSGAPDDGFAAPPPPAGAPENVVVTGAPPPAEDAPDTAAERERGGLLDGLF